jgi:mannitol-specific phosphotransferase system IIBC component
MFVEDENVILTNDVWKIVIHIDLSTYENVIAEFHQDLIQAREFSHTHTSARELQQVHFTLTSLEQKLSELKKILPRVDSRRGLINLGSSFLKALFCTATVMDLDKLHSTVRELHENEKTIIHSVNQRVTYTKQLDESVKLKRVLFPRIVTAGTPHNS